MSQPSAPKDHVGLLEGRARIAPRVTAKVAAEDAQHNGLTFVSMKA